MNGLDALLGTLDRYANLLLLGLAFFGAVLVAVSLAPERFFVRRERRKRQRSVGIEDLDARLRRVELVEAIGSTPERYQRTSLVFTLLVGLILGAVTLSWGAALAGAITVFLLRRSRLSGRVEKLRTRVLINEVIPAAQGISGALSAGMSISQALADVGRGSNPTSLQYALRRAMADSRGLEEGLRDERRRNNSDILREFYEILADGASTSRQSAMTAETLDKFADLSMARRSAYQAAIRVTAQARSTRTILTVLVPGVLVFTTLISGNTAILQHTTANVVVLAILGLIGGAYVVTNMFINDVVSGY